jgi:hypothetical protein
MRVGGLLGGNRFCVLVASGGLGRWGAYTTRGLGCVGGMPAPALRMTCSRPNLKGWASIHIYVHRYLQVRKNGSNDKTEHFGSLWKSQSSLLGGVILAAMVGLVGQPEKSDLMRPAGEGTSGGWG